MDPVERRPVWLLDVDGVVNAASKKPDRSVWPADAWVRGHATANGHDPVRHRWLCPHCHTKNTCCE